MRSEATNGAPGRTRTYDLLVRSQALYPAELRGHVESMNEVSYEMKGLRRLTIHPPQADTGAR